MELTTGFLQGVSSAGGYFYTRAVGTGDNGLFLMDVRTGQVSILHTNNIFHSISYAGNGNFRGWATNTESEVSYVYEFSTLTGTLSVLGNVENASDINYAQGVYSFDPSENALYIKGFRYVDLDSGTMEWGIFKFDLSSGQITFEENESAGEWNYFEVLDGIPVYFIAGSAYSIPQGVMTYDEVNNLYYTTSWIFDDNSGAITGQQILQLGKNGNVLEVLQSFEIRHDEFVHDIVYDSENEMFFALVADGDTNIVVAVNFSGNTFNVISVSHEGDEGLVFQYEGNTIISDAGDGNWLRVERQEDTYFSKLYVNTDGGLVLEGTNGSSITVRDPANLLGIQWVPAGVEDGYSEYSISIQDLVIGTMAEDVLSTPASAYVEAYGADGNDQITIFSGSSWVSGDGGSDLVYGGLGNDAIHGDYRSQLTGNDSLFGGAGNDRLWGEAGQDLLNGGDGDDTLDGGAGTDSLIGGLGDDVYIVEDAGDVVTEAASEGTDTVEVAVDYVLGENLENLTLLEVPHETQVVVTSYLNGQQYAESVSVGTGSLNVQNDFDLVIGGQLGWTPRRWAGGIDELRLWSTVRSAEQVAASYGSAVTGVEAGLAAYFSFDNLVGGVAEDAVSGLSATAYGGVAPIVGAPITGGASAVYLDGSGYLVVPDAGNSTLDLAGNFTIEAWIYADAWGDEFATILAKNYSHPSDNVAYSVVRWGSEDKLTLSTFGAWSSYEAGFAAAIEPAILGPDVVNGYWHHIAFTYQTRQANDLSGTGNTLNNVITGNSGNNTLTGDAGNDTLNGGTGTDTLIGGSGDDTYVTDGGDTITEAADAGTDTVFTNVNLFLPNHVENATYVGTSQWVNGDLIGGHIVGNTGANVLMGNDGVNFLSGAGGIDNLDGKEGSDIYWFGAFDIEDRTTGEINDSGVNGVDEVRFHALSGSLKLYQNDTGIERVFIGNSPGSGTSQIVNPSLPYALSVDASEVLNQLYIAGNFGANVLTGTSYSDTILGYDGSDTVIGGAGDDDIDGGAGNDSLDGGDGDDTLDGGSGSDKLDGGAGNDIYITDGGDTITEGANAGTDTVQSSVNYTLGANLENMTLTGSAAINGTGNTLNNVITGNSSNNTLNGNIGTDTLIGGVGDDTYIINGRDTIVEEANAGTDTVRSSVTYTLANNLENLTLTGSASINGIGNALANVLVGNNGANTLVGGTGSDTLIGGAGRDVLTGGLGNDLFVYNTIKESRTAALSMDLITDFVSGQDKIDLSAIDAFAGVANVNDSFIWKGSEAFSSATEGEVRYEKFINSGTANDYTMVWIDNDRDAGVEMAIRLTGLHNLTASDFVL